MPKQRGDMSKAPAKSMGQIGDEKYVITADCAEGNPKSDFQAASVWKCTEPTKPVQVASLHIRTLKPGSFGIQCACMAYCYGNLPAGPRIERPRAPSCATCS